MVEAKGISMATLASLLSDQVGVPVLDKTALGQLWDVHLQFLAYGVRLGGVVNQDRHVRTLRDSRPRANECSKYPPAFGIDLLVDNSQGVKEEGQRTPALPIGPYHPGFVGNNPGFGCGQDC